MSACSLIGKVSVSKTEGFPVGTEQACQKTEGDESVNVVKFKPNDYIKCVTSNDFYKAINLYDTIKSGTIKNVYQMKINPITYTAVEEQLKTNWKHNKITRHLTKDKAQSMISFDWMNFSPVQDKNVPENEIWWEIANETAANV